MSKRTRRAAPPSDTAQLIGYAVSWIISIGAIVVVVAPLVAIGLATFKAVKTHRGEWPQMPEWIDAIR